VFKLEIIENCELDYGRNSLEFMTTQREDSDFVSLCDPAPPPHQTILPPSPRIYTQLEKKHMHASTANSVLPVYIRTTFGQDTRLHEVLSPSAHSTETARRIPLHGGGVPGHAPALITAIDRHIRQLLRSDSRPPITEQYPASPQLIRMFR
jgi:hypothetical protein